MAYGKGYSNYSDKGGMYKGSSAGHTSSKPPTSAPKPSMGGNQDDKYACPGCCQHGYSMKIK